MNLFQSTDRFRPYLSPGERILWTGQPKQGLALSGSDSYLIPFSLLWGGFAFYWNYSVWTDFDDDWFFRLWGIPFLLAGFYFIFGHFFHDAIIRRNLHYAVTDRRVLFLHGKRSAKFTSRDIQSLPMIELTEHRNGTGTIIFDSEDVGYSVFRPSRRSNEWAPNAKPNSQLFRIENPRRVYELIRNQAYS